jgi:hypothetical protein
MAPREYAPPCPTCWRYERLRGDTHDGPPIVALRLYELEWTIDRDAANVDSPDRRRFIAEVRP